MSFTSGHGKFDFEVRSNPSMFKGSVVAYSNDIEDKMSVSPDDPAPNVIPGYHA